MLPETISRLGWPGVAFLPIRSRPPSANLHLADTTEGDASVVRVFLKILKQAFAGAIKLRCPAN